MTKKALRVFATIVLFCFLVVCHQALFDKFQVGIKWFTDESRDNQSSATLVFKEKPLLIWTTDFHIGPIHDLKTFLKPMGVRFIDKNLDYTRCGRTRTCEGMKTLKLINPHNARDLDYSWIPKFYQLYANDTEMDSVDAFGCFHLPALCELYEPFNKSLIILSTIRYELGRFGKERWTRWNNNLIRYAANPKNLIAANNLYDVNYIKYFTGIEPVWLPSFSSHPNVKYNRSREGFVIAHNTNPGFFNSFIQQYTKLCTEKNCTVRLGELYGWYGNYKYSDIVAHQGIVHVPYQVSVMSFFEHYRMDIPIFAPSLELLIQWEWKHWAMRERTWQGAHGPQPVGSAIEPHPSQRSIPDPNCYKEDTVRYWVKFSDYYQFPHIIYYDSIEHLITLLHTTTAEELIRVSEKMRLFNYGEEKRLRKKWRDILLNIAKHSTNDPH